MRILLFLVACSVVAFAARGARADAKGEARRHFDAGNAAYSSGEFVHAAAEYKAAFEETRDPALLYNIAQAYRLGGDATHAIFFYRSYLRHVPAATNRREVEERMATLEQQRAAGPAPDAGAPAPGKQLRDPHQTPPIILRAPEEQAPNSSDVARNATDKRASTVSNTVAHKLPPTPSGLTVSGSGGVCVSWSAVAGASTYDVYYSTVAGDAKAARGSAFTSTTTSSSVDRLDSKTVYYFAVSAGNAGGRSTPSAEVASKTGAPACP